MSNLSDDESMYSAAATVANSDIATVCAELSENPRPIQITADSEECCDDGEFEPTVEMMVHDFDDEKTLDEEENLAFENNESYLQEVDALQKESEMPLEELLKMYAAAASPPVVDASPKTKKKKSGLSSALQRSKKAKKRAAAALCDASTSAEGLLLQETSSFLEIEETPDEEPEVESSFYEEVSTGVDEQVTSTTKDIPEEDENTSLLAKITTEEDVEEEEDDGDYFPEETVNIGDSDDLNKVKIGQDFQASIPDGLCKYDDVLPYNNEDKLVWCPFAIEEKEIESYLDNYRELDKIQQQQIENEKKLEKKKGGGTPTPPLSSAAATAASIVTLEEKNPPTSTTDDAADHVQLTHQHLRSSSNNLRDDEQALYLLLQCGFNFEEALRRKKVNNGVCCSFPFASPMSSWSEEECRSFESGMRLSGKNFYIIAKNKVTTRSVSEICEFYYSWKKTTRYDAFVNKQNYSGTGINEDKKMVNNFKKNNSSSTDFMDKFLDEDSSASDTYVIANGRSDADSSDKSNSGGGGRKRRRSSENNNQVKSLKKTPTRRDSEQLERDGVRRSLMPRK